MRGGRKGDGETLLMINCVDKIGKYGALYVQVSPRLSIRFIVPEFVNNNTSNKNIQDTYTSHNLSDTVSTVPRCSVRACKDNHLEPLSSVKTLLELNPTQVGFMTKSPRVPWRGGLGSFLTPFNTILV